MTDPNPPTVLGVRNLDQRNHLQRLNDWDGSDASGVGTNVFQPGATEPRDAQAIALTATAPEPSPVAPDDGLRHPYMLMERAQVDGVIRRIGDIVHLFAHEAGPHMQFLKEKDSEMTDAQFDELKSMLMHMLAPVRELAVKQLEAMNPPQMPMSTRTLIGTDATRQEAAEAAAPYPVEPHVLPHSEAIPDPADAHVESGGAPREGGYPHEG